MEKLPTQTINLFKRVNDWLKHVWHSRSYGLRAWRGAAFGLMFGALVIAAIMSYNLFINAGWFIFVLGFLSFLLVAAISG